MEDLTGKQFGHYQIVAPLGEGGMAAVYKAYQPSMERYVAIKVLPRQMAISQEFLARFKLEAKLLAQLQHPHILPVFDYGETDGYTYIVMSYIKSGTLADLMKTRRFSMAEIGAIISQIGSALGYAHMRGMIHRDVKPSNVLIDETGNCLLTDFGLARMVEAPSNLTSSGAIMGTPSYMSPEQGAGTKIDKRSDIYSLGVILFELLAGRVPYTAETPVAIVFKHIQDPLPSVRKYNPDLSAEIEAILYKALAKNPEDRYPTVEDFVRAFEQANSFKQPPVQTNAQDKIVETIALPAKNPASPPLPPTISTNESDIPPREPLIIPQPDRIARWETKPPSTPSLQTAPRKSRNTFGLLAAFALVIICFIAAGAAFLGYQMVSSGQAAQQATGTADALAAANDTATVEAFSTIAVSQTQSAVATATAAEAAYRANATATAANMSAQATANWKQADVLEKFDDNSNKWLTPIFDATNAYWSGKGLISNGMYQFKVIQTRKPFAYLLPYSDLTANDFDLKVSARQLGGTPDQVCYGLFYRANSDQQDYFVVCDNQNYSIEHFDGKNYVTLRDWTKSTAIKPGEWNTLWVSGRKNTFVFYINDQQVDTVNTNSLLSGSMGIFFEVFNKDTPTVQFDNFSIIKQ